MEQFDFSKILWPFKALNPYTQKHWVDNSGWLTGDEDIKVSAKPYLEVRNHLIRLQGPSTQFIYPGVMHVLF